MFIFHFISFSPQSISLISSTIVYSINIYLIWLHSLLHFISLSLLHFIVHVSSPFLQSTRYCSYFISFSSVHSFCSYFLNFLQSTAHLIHFIYHSLSHSRLPYMVALIITPHSLQSTFYRSCFTFISFSPHSISFISFTIVHRNQIYLIRLHSYYMTIQTYDQFSLFSQSRLWK